MGINDISEGNAGIQRYFGVTPPTVHKLILGLERNGLISREPARHGPSACYSIQRAFPDGSRFVTHTPHNTHRNYEKPERIRRR